MKSKLSNHPNEETSLIGWLLSVSPYYFIVIFLVLLLIL